MKAFFHFPEPASSALLVVVAAAPASAAPAVLRNVLRSMLIMIAHLATRVGQAFQPDGMDTSG